MKRRELLSSILSLSIASVVPNDSDLRKQYMERLFPSKYDVRTCDSGGIQHYDAMYIDSENGVQYHYYWDSKHREHRYRIKVYGEDPLDILSITKGKAQSVAEAKEDLEEEIAIPRVVK